MKKKHAYTFKLKFYLKSCSNVYFLKDILNKASLIFAQTVFFDDSLRIKNRFHYVKCFSQVAAKCTKNELQIKSVMCRRPQSQNQKKFFNSSNIKQMLRLYSTSCRSVFRTHSNIYAGVFFFKVVDYFHKKTPWQMFDWTLNMPLSWYVVIGTASWLQRHSKSNLSQY